LMRTARGATDSRATRPQIFNARLNAEFTADCGSTKMSLIEIGAPRYG
jgi:hypothetical protein